MPQCKNPYCPLQQALSIIGGKWKPVILYTLKNSPKRFGQLHSQIQGLSRKVLTDHLNEMLADGLISRTTYAVSPPRVDYELTQVGKDLLPIFEQLANWGKPLVSAYKKSVQLSTPKS